MAKRTTKPGHRRLKGQWTPKRAHAFCLSRVKTIELLLEEIAATYNDIDQTVVYEIDRLRDEQLPQLGRTLDEALEEGRTL
ncbi:hypothetical protein [Shinella sp. G-2]|uniref:hypothetical protein n=1 Tax=Shinella sp. G-2 TaxID=3133141 RepID=UPI003CFD300E